MRAKLLLLLLLAPGLSGCAMELFEKPEAKTRKASVYDSMTPGTMKVDKQLALSMISQYRQANGLNPLRLDPLLNAMAQAQANAMAARGVMSHDVSGSFHDRSQKAGLKAVASGENVAAGYDTLADAFSGWRHSPGHNANMLMPAATRFGIATSNAPNTRYKIYWAMIVAGDPPRAPQPAATASAGPFGMVFGQ